MRLLELKQNNNMQRVSLSVPTAHDLLQDLFYLATPTQEEEKLCQLHKHEIPAILNGLKHQEKIGKYIVKTETKICTRCGEEKSIEEFAKKDKEKYRNFCKQCDAERVRKIYQKHKKREEQEMSETITKICTKCGKEKTLEEFNNDKRGKYGHKSICRECEKIQKDEYRGNLKICNPEPIKPEFDRDNFKRYLMYQIEATKNLITKLQGKIETYQELIGEL